MAYTASLSTTLGRQGFAVSFRHPLKLDSKGKPGLKMRRGLGTDDKVKAESLVAQLNQLLQDEAWWTIAKLQKAQQTFDSRIVDAFYDGIQAGMVDSFVTRNSIIPLPGKEQGYARALFVGTTGAGKTSLLRHLIGSDPDLDRFPSTSTAKTTVSDIEVIPAEGEYRAVVTFFSETVIQANIEDCILNACAAVWDKLPEDKVADRFLHHPDQRFRLSYLLGSWRKNLPVEPAADEWDFGGNDNVTMTAVSSDETMSTADVEVLQTQLVDYVSRITKLAVAKSKVISDELSLDSHMTTAEDREAALELFQEELFLDEQFNQIVHDVIDEARRRFDFLSDGELKYRSPSSKWPLMWTYSTNDRTEFLKQVRWFSSNFAPSFGKLLTPLVDGIRVMGPLFPTFSDHQAKVVLLDGQGLGHTPDSSTSVTTRITRRFAEVDVILLVDNAEQPIQAAAQSVLRAVASSGNYSKLLIAFTHFDQVKGLNLPTFAEKRAHVLASVHNYLAKLKAVLSTPIVAAMERTIDNQSFMLGALDGPSTKLPLGVRAQLNQLIELTENSVEPLPVPDAKPHYNASGLGFAVQRAADSFQKTWLARLGLAAGATLPAEHWSRIKALSRAISNETSVEYDSLRPVADLVGHITEEVTNFLDNPIGWSRAPNDTDEVQQAIAPIRRLVFDRLHQLVLRRLIDEHLQEWRDSFGQKGKGSAVRRAIGIRGIYECAAPVPGTVNTTPALELLLEVHELVRNAVIENGGMMLT